MQSVLSGILQLNQKRENRGFFREMHVLPTSTTDSRFRATAFVTQAKLLADSDRRAAIEGALPTFPTELADLITGYDAELAMQPFRCDERGALADSEENRAIGLAIQHALSSRDVDPKIKRQIIVNVIQTPYRQAKEEFNRLLAELHGKSIPVNLDNTDLSGLQMINIQFGLTCAINVNLSRSILQFMNLSRSFLTNANLKGASLTGVNLVSANLHGALFDQTRFDGCKATDLLTNDTGLRHLVVQFNADLILHGTRTTKPAQLQNLAMRLTVPPVYFVPQCSIS